MEKIIFIYNGKSTTIQCQKDEYLKDICQKFASKVNAELSKIYFLYGGKVLDINQTFNNIYDKNYNIIKILVYSLENNNSNNSKENPKEIICPKCENNCLINFDEYKINTSGCKFYHNTNNITLNEFINSQKIDSSKKICKDCENNNKSISYNFYKCLTCKKDICPLCMNQNHKEHNNIEYDKVNYIYNLHNESFNSFCKKCNENLCIFCESGHKDKENIIYYRDILLKKDLMKNQIEELKNIINIYKEKIEEIKNILDKINTNLEIYFNINDNLYKNFEDKNRNFQILKSMNNIVNNNNIIEELNMIKNKNDKIEFLSNIFKIYKKMTQKN